MNVIEIVINKILINLTDYRYFLHSGNAVVSLRTLIHSLDRKSSVIEIVIERIHNKINRTL